MAAPTRPKPVEAPSAAGSPLRAALTATLQVLGTAGGLILALVVAFLLRDSITVGSHLSHAKTQRTDLICQDGRMVHGDGSLLDWIFADDHFICTDWRTLQAADQAQLK